MNKSELIQSLLNKSTYSIQEMADHIGVTRNNFYFYKSGRSIPRKSTLNKLAELLEVRLVWDGSDSVEIADGLELETPKIELKETDMELEAVKLKAKEEFEHKNRLIYYQEKEIEHLRKKLQQVESENNLIKLDNAYEDCTPHFQTEVHMRNVFSLKSIERNINSIDNIEPLAKALNIDKKELYNKYFCFGKWFKNDEHPVDTIIDENSLAVLKSATAGIPKQAKLFQFTMGAFYLKFEVLYLYKDAFCMTQSICKINWSTTPIVNSKNIILHSGNIENLDKEINA